MQTIFCPFHFSFKFLFCCKSKFCFKSLIINYMALFSVDLQELLQKGEIPSALSGSITPSQWSIIRESVRKSNEDSRCLTCGCEWATCCFCCFPCIFCCHSCLHSFMFHQMTERYYKCQLLYTIYFYFYLFYL
jgi:hypothetical protein